MRNVVAVMRGLHHSMNIIDTTEILSCSNNYTWNREQSKTRIESIGRYVWALTPAEFNYDFCVLVALHEVVLISC